MAVARFFDFSSESSQTIHILSLLLILSIAAVGGSVGDSEMKEEEAKEWPFDDTRRCATMNTRDTDYEGRAESSFVQSPFCGLNRFSKAQDSDVSVASSPVARGASSTADDGGWLKEFRRYVARIYSSLYADGKAGERETRRRRAWKTSRVWNGHVEKGEMEVDGEEAEKELVEIGRIVGGHKTEQGEWPWLAAIGTKVRGHYCGGSLIADRWVLTAAHCFKDEEDPCRYNIRLGSINWISDSSGTSADVTPDAIYRHPNFDAETSANDVALLRLSESVALDKSGFINAICLPEVERSVENGTVCIAAGWGLQYKKSPNAESYEVDLPVLTYEDTCGSYANGTMKPGMICAGYLEGGKDTCQGDSGGPITYKRNGRWTQLGITSFGYGCARPGYPGIYTDVGGFLHWIGSVIDRHS